MQQLTFVRRGKLEWREVPEPVLEGGQDAIVRPLIAARCDLDFFVVMGMFPIFEGPFPIGHEFVGVALEGPNEGQRPVIFQTLGNSSSQFFELPSIIQWSRGSGSKDRKTSVDDKHLY